MRKQNGTKRTAIPKGEIVRNQEYIEKVAGAKIGLHRDTMRAVINAVWETICEEVAKGNAVRMHGKGTCYLSKRSSRMGRNPATGEEYEIPEREALAFQTSPAYAKRLRRIREQYAAENQAHDVADHEQEAHGSLDIRDTIGL